MYCPNCGNKVSKDDNFCAVCGKNLKNVHIKIEDDDFNVPKKKKNLSEETRVFKPVSIDKIDTTNDIKNIIAEVDKKISKNIAEHETGSADLSSRDYKNADEAKNNRESKSSDKINKKENQNSDKKSSKKSDSSHANNKKSKKPNKDKAKSENLNDNFNISQKELIKRVQEELKKSNYQDNYDESEENDSLNDYFDSSYDLDSQEKKPKKFSFKEKWGDFINEDDDEFSIFSSYKEKSNKTKEDTIDVVKSTDMETNNFENTLNTPKINIKDIEKYEAKKSESEDSKNKDYDKNLEKEKIDKAKKTKNKNSNDNSLRKFLNNFKTSDAKNKTQTNKTESNRYEDKNISSNKSKEKIKFNKTDKNKDFTSFLNSAVDKVSVLNDQVSSYIGALGSKNSKIVLAIGAALTLVQIIVAQKGFNFALIIAIILKLGFDYIEFYFPLKIAVERDDIYISNYEIRKNATINWIICKVFLFVAFLISPFGGFLHYNLLAALTAMPLATVILIILSLLIALSQFKEEFKERSFINFIGWYALTFILFELLFKMLWFLVNFIFVTLL